MTALKDATKLVIDCRHTEEEEKNIRRCVAEGVHILVRSWANFPTAFVTTTVLVDAVTDSDMMLQIEALKKSIAPTANEFVRRVINKLNEVTAKENDRLFALGYATSVVIYKDDEEVDDIYKVIKMDLNFTIGGVFPKRKSMKRNLDAL